ncbi:MAG: helix-turn-helix protein [Candidatus Angelobacter sp.]|nr:helix-turn-helix protein [Candidatus Angelobacter sp.]
MNSELRPSIDKPWTTEQAADFLSIHPRTVTRMAVMGEIPAFRIGTHWRFRPIDVDSWMKQRVSSRAEHNPVRGN